MAALFGNESDGRREPKSLVEFRAGKMKLSGTTVTADVRKGLVYMKQEDRLMHFCWKDRKSGEVVDDLIIFPGEVEFKRVSQCTTGRVFLLKFHDRPDRKYFYWMQEPKESRDEEFQKKVNDLITSPPDPSQALGEGGIGGGLQSLIGGHGLQSLLAGPHSNPQLLEQLLTSGALSPLQSSLFEGIGGGSSSSSGRGASSGGGGSSGRSGDSGGGTSAGEREASSVSSRQASSRSTRQQQQQPQLQQQQPQQQQQQQQSVTPHQVLQLGDLQNILSAMNIPPSDATPQEDAISLPEVLNSEVLRPLSGDPSVRAQVESHLPPTSEAAESVLTSPQFQQALGTFGSALQSGQLGPLMNQFGLGGQVVNAATSGDVDGFARALQDELGESESSGAGKEEKNDSTSKEEDQQKDKAESSSEKEHKD